MEEESLENVNVVLLAFVAETVVGTGNKLLSEQTFDLLLVRF